MRVNKYILPALVIVMLLGTVVIAQASGYWIVSGKQMVDVNNLQSTTDIKGWMTLQQVADGLDIDQPTLYELIDIPPDIPPETLLKEIEAFVPGFEVRSARETLAEYLAEQ